MIGRIIDVVKNAYLESADWVSEHPHLTIIGALVAIAFAAAVL